MKKQKIKKKLTALNVHIDAKLSIIMAVEMNFSSIKNKRLRLKGEKI